MVDLRGTPTFLYDGDCSFCRTWAEYWRERTAGQVHFSAYQDDAQARARFGDEALATAAHIIETDGTAHAGARAVFSLLSRSSKWYWFLALAYDVVPPFSWASDFVYRWVARHRPLCATITRAMWGLPHDAGFQRGRRVFIKLLGVTYLAAFGSAAVQIVGLVGAGGILPASGLLASAAERFGAEALLLYPTLAWLSSSDGMLTFLALAGIVAAAAVVMDVALFAALAVAWACWLSLVTVGQTFFAFQWDALLVETGFLALMLVPFAGLRGQVARPVPSWVRWLLWLVLFKVIWGSGWVKVLSGDVSWRELTALQYHFLTQPLPNAWSSAFSRAPVWLLQFGTWLTLFAELVIPWLYWFPRRLRHLGALVTAGFQLLLALTGNFAFYNLAVLTLCALLLDDSFYGGARRLFHRHALSGQVPISTRTRAKTKAAKVRDIGDLVLPGRRHERFLARLKSTARTGGIAALFGLNGLTLLATFHGSTAPLAVMPDAVRSARVVNQYGAFAVMTTSRVEVVIEGSLDGNTWHEYDFAFKPGGVRVEPRQAAPHDPRLDWQMWFLQFGTAKQHPWFSNLLLRLLQNSPSVTGLLARNPFPDTPPRYVRAQLYRYEYTTREERMVDGAYWKREPMGTYFPIASMDTLAEVIRGLD